MALRPRKKQLILLKLRSTVAPRAKKVEERCLFRIFSRTQTLRLCSEVLQRRTKTIWISGWAFCTNSRNLESTITVRGFGTAHRHVPICDRQCDWKIICGRDRGSAHEQCRWNIVWVCSLEQKQFVKTIFASVFRKSLDIPAGPRTPKQKQFGWEIVQGWHRAPRMCKNNFCVRFWLRKQRFSVRRFGLAQKQYGWTTIRGFFYIKKRKIHDCAVLRPSTEKLQWMDFPGPENFLGSSGEWWKSYPQWYKAMTQGVRRFWFTHRSNCLLTMVRYSLPHHHFWLWQWRWSAV